MSRICVILVIMCVIEIGFSLRANERSMRTTKRYDFFDDDSDSDSDDYSDDDDFDDMPGNKRKATTSRSDMTRYLGGKSRSKRQIPASVHVPVSQVAALSAQTSTHSPPKATTPQDIEIPAKIKVH